MSPSQSSLCYVIGPTPQKDGVVLGLFDNIPSTTPRKPTRIALEEVSFNVAQTPSRKALNNDRDPLATGRKLSRTPQSTGKRFMLDTFATPVKRKLADESTPSSAKRVATPAFLRRSSQALDPVAEDDDEVSAVRPWQRRSFGRSLSSMIQDMRRQEDEQLDEEIDILREIEAEEASKAQGNRQLATVDTSIEDPDLEQFLEDIDRHGEKDTGEQSQDEPRRWKKKGPKRQTKRAILRPVQPKARPKNQQSQQPLNDDDGGEDSDGLDDDDPTGSDRDFDDKDNDNDNETAARKKAAGNSNEAEVDPKKNKRKINPNAVSHANFRSLKIKNKNSKARGRGRRR